MSGRYWPHHERYGLHLEDLLRIMEKADLFLADDPFEIMLRAANSIPPTASDFDKGIAAGIALERWLRISLGLSAETTSTKG